MSFIFFSFSTYAQTADNPWALGVNLNPKEYKGDLGNSYFTFNSLNVNPGLTLNRYVNNIINVNLGVNVGWYVVSPVIAVLSMVTFTILL